jgi:hypothetical protein
MQQSHLNENDSVYEAALHQSLYLAGIYEVRGAAFIWRRMCTQKVVREGKENERALLLPYYLSLLFSSAFPSPAQAAGWGSQ